MQDGIQVLSGFAGVHCAFQSPCSVDFSGNVAGHYEEMIKFFAEGCNQLDDGNRKSIKRKEGQERQDVLCSQCGFVLGPGSDRCLSCGAAKHRRKPKLEQGWQIYEFTVSGE